MALRTRRRERPDGSDEITAGMDVDMRDETDVAYIDGTVRRSKLTGRSSWDWYKKIGEVRYSVNRAARVAGFAEFFCEKLVEGAARGRDERWERLAPNSGSATDKIAADIVQGLYSPWHGRRGLITRFYGHMKVPGDSYFVRIRADESDGGGYDGYSFVSASEIDDLAPGSVLPSRAGRPIQWRTLPEASGAGYGRSAGSPFVKLIQPEDFLGRVWTPGMQYLDEAESPLMALETECDVLHKLTLTMKAKLMQRLALAGLLYIPSEITAAKAKSRDKAPTTIDDLLTYLVEVMSTNVRNFEDATAYAPILMRGPGSVANQINMITIDREIFASDIALRGELIGRILFGMDTTQAASTGDPKNHFDGWAASEEEVRLSVRPDIDNALWFLNRVVLHRQLQAASVEPAQILRYRIGVDMSAASAKTNRSDDLRQLNDRGGASLAVLRRAAGLGEEEALDGVEYVRWVGRLVKDPYLMTFETPEADKIDWEKVNPATRGPGADQGGDDPDAGPGVGNPGSPDENPKPGPKPKS